jgi:flotillin
LHPDFAISIFGVSGTGALLVFVTVIVIALLIFYVASRYHVANANEALIVAGSRGAKVRDEKGQLLAAPSDRGVKVVVGGGTFVLPLVNKVARLKLTARQISVQLTDAVTSQGIKVHVQGVATFKIGRDVESLRNAAERFLDSKDEQVDSIVKNVLEGSLRSIVGTLTIEELIMDRQKLQQAVQDAAKGDLATSGLQIDAFTIQSISDESNYIELLGQQKLSVVTRDARMAKAAADQQAAVREAEAEQVKINAQRDVSLKRADALVQTAAAEARAGQAGPLAQADAQQEVVRKQTELADLEAARKEKELLSTTVKPAAAEAQAVIQRAEGEKRARIASAEADAETTRLEGGAEAAIVLTKGEAEAKALALRADAYKQFNDAALIQTILAALPDIVRAAAEPMAHIDSLTVMSADGATDLVKNGTRAVIESATAIKGLTGLDVPALIGNAMDGTVQKAGAAARAEVQRRAEQPPNGEPQPAAAASAPAVAELPHLSVPKPVESEATAGAISGATAIDRARALAAQLAAMPGIDQYLDVTLNDLEAKAPRRAGALWRVSADVLKPLYGEMSVRELLQKFAGKSAA